MQNLPTDCYYNRCFLFSICTNSRLEEAKEINILFYNSIIQINKNDDNKKTIYCSFIKLTCRSLQNETLGGQTTETNKKNVSHQSI